MSLPIWQTIRDQLTAEISEGRLQSGAKLPTEAELAVRFGVNRHTVRRALGEMRDAGMVHARRGSGVFVTSRPVAYRLGARTRFTQPLAEQGHAGTRRILRLETVKASALEADLLDLPGRTPVLIMESIGVIDGHPATHGHGVFPILRLPGLEDALRETSSITTALAAIGLPDYKRLWTRIRAERASGLIARHLHLPEGAPVMRTRSLNVDPAGRPVELGNTHFCADRIELLVAPDD
ncbi:MAG: phosphonate metabolism transcriptional regulator PhnF [Paracoccaceae bacterium]